MFIPKISMHVKNLYSIVMNDETKKISLAQNGRYLWNYTAALPRTFTSNLFKMIFSLLSNNKLAVPEVTIIF